MKKKAYICKKRQNFVINCRKNEKKEEICRKK